MRTLCCSPRVVGTQRADFTSLRSLLDSPPFAGKTGEDLILAIYDYFTSTVDGSYHFWPMDERAAAPQLRRTLYDPLKMINAYGFMVCGQQSTFLYALYREAGFPARQFGVPGHSLCEVFYDGRWHILDVDMWTWFRTPEGHIASAYELATNASQLILENNNRSNPCNLPDRKLEDYTRMYASAETHDGEVKGIWPHWGMRAHTMDFYLRPGESMSRSQTHTGRFHMPQSWKPLMSQYASEWKHGQPHERYAPFRTFGNGTWTYAPNLSARYRDFSAGVWEHSNIKQTDAGLESPSTEGVAVFRVLSPYPFCGRPDWSGEKITSRDGVWLECVSQGAVRAEISTAEGGWQSVEIAGGRADITALMDGRYESLIRFTLQPGARLSSFKFHGYTMTAPMSVPRLVEGRNPMQLRSLDQHHLRTEPWSRVVDFRSSADFNAQRVTIQRGKTQPYVSGWNSIAPTGSEPVSVSAKFTAPAGRKFAWIYGLASVREGPADAPPRRALLEWSPDGETWWPLGAIALPNTPLQWDASVDGSAVWTVPLSEVHLRVTSDTAVTGLEFYGHLDIPNPHSGEIQVVHRWTEKGASKEFTASLGATDYVVVCGAEPADHSIELRVPTLIF
ncbi:MAG TPA: hypothetical protein VEJ63_22830 [Planctomycetota bacterium]|nr:hypothetical protein [Planctomycetota bacterium]